MNYPDNLLDNWKNWDLDIFSRYPDINGYFRPSILHKKGLILLKIAWIRDWNVRSFTKILSLLVKKVSIFMILIGKIAYFMILCKNSWELMNIWCKFCFYFPKLALYLAKLGYPDNFFRYPDRSKIQIIKKHG